MEDDDFQPECSRSVFYYRKQEVSATDNKRASKFARIAGKRHSPLASTAAISTLHSKSFKSTAQVEDTQSSGFCSKDLSSADDCDAVSTVMTQVLDSMDDPFPCVAAENVCEIGIGGIAAQDGDRDTNACLDETHTEAPSAKAKLDISPVVSLLERLDLSKYASLFVQQEIDWDTLQWLTDEDLNTLGISTFGPRKKILVALQELRQGPCVDADQQIKAQPAAGKRYITDFFGNPSGSRPVEPQKRKRGVSAKLSKSSLGATYLPPWKRVPGTSFRVDAFQYLTNECAHWFLTHFHSDHYQGLTKGFRFGKVYCSLITARLVNVRIGVPWDRLYALPLNERISIDGVWVTLLDANHCPGATMILFELPNGKVVLHSGDFRYCDGMASIKSLTSVINTLVLDTTYCNPQYDFPEQETVIQFVIDAIQAESFNPKTLFLIGTYTLGKERLFLEVARVLKKKIHVAAVKLRMLNCIDLNAGDVQWLTTNAQESCIHVVPLWSISSFKRMASIARHYQERFDTIVSFSPTGWSVGRGKKRSPGKRQQQGTIVRYEVPYSEHSSFTELKKFVKLMDPETIIPSVNNSSPLAAANMIKSLRQ